MVHGICRAKDRKDQAARGSNGFHDCVFDKLRGDDIFYCDHNVQRDATNDYGGVHGVLPHDTLNRNKHFCHNCELHNC